MTHRTQLALTPKDRLLQLAQEELSKFEEADRKFRRKDRAERAHELSLPVQHDELH